MLNLPTLYEDAEKYTDDLCEFVTTPLVQQLTGGIHVNDALIYDAWGSLPDEWTAWWSSWPDHRTVQHDLIDSIDEKTGSELETTDSPPLFAQSRPESLTKWLQKIRSLALPRTERESPVVSLPEALTSRMNTKKIKEVSKAAYYIHSVCQRKGIARIVDMGSGQGYLSVTLAHLFPHLSILAIDGSESQIVGSQSFAADLGIPDSRLKHMAHWIDGSDTLAIKISKWARGESCMLVGLHACGNLSEHMLGHFAASPCIEALAAIGCCYNHIVPRSPSHPEGFPISMPLRKNNVTLSPTALMTACQAPNNWQKPTTKNLEDENSVFSRRRLYRTILEKLFFDKGIKVDGAGGRPAWGTRKGDLADFTKFAHRAMDCLGVDKALIPTPELLAYEERYRAYGGRIAILWTLSVLCCKVIESLIVMDRYWYLIGKNIEEVDVFPIFDVKISPRNLIIVAEKSSRV
ncbi:Protein RRNAD1 [Paramyrothecium foliicola]|nr:Protein RRNAD1 [Paramyrothecium foliicola]